MPYDLVCISREVILIFEKFFIQFTDLIIKILLFLSNPFISIFEKKSDDNYDDNGTQEESLNTPQEESSLRELNLFDSDFDLFKIFKKENIIEDLENKYFNNPNFLNRDLSKNNWVENNTSGENKFAVLKRKVMISLLNNKLFKIQSSQDLLKLIFLCFIGFISVCVLIALFLSFELSLILLITVLLIAFLIVYYPKIKHENEYSSISKELPYALRQLSTELKAGKSLFDSLDSVAESDYGVLSLEFSRVLEEIKYGESSENAFLNLDKRVKSKALSRVIFEILSCLRIGSNLSNSLNIIAEDVNFDMRMKLKEYSEKLNAFIMIYTFLAILAPVIVLTMLLAASVVIGDLVPGDLVLILYGLFFPMIIVFLAIMIKKLEPKI